MTRKHLDLEQIPTVLEEVVALIRREIATLQEKDHLTGMEARTVVSYAATLSGIYKDYRTEAEQIKKELKGKSKEEILKLVRAEARN